MAVQRKGEGSELDVHDGWEGLRGKAATTVAKVAAAVGKAVPATIRVTESTFSIPEEARFSGLPKQAMAGHHFATSMYNER